MKADQSPSLHSSGETSQEDTSRIAQQKLLLERLIKALTLIQNRLGTPWEREDDCQKARDLGHEIRNKMHVLQLWGLPAKTFYNTQISASSCVHSWNSPAPFRPQGP